MKRMMITALAMSVLSGKAIANDFNIYGSLNYLIGAFEESGADGYINGLALKSGLCKSGFCIEGRLGTSVNNITVDRRNESIEIGPDNFMGLYALYKYDTGIGLKPYAVVGKTEADVKRLSSKVESVDDVSFGFGADFLMTKKIIGNLEYMAYLDGDDITLGGINLGVGIEYGF